MAAQGLVVENAVKRTHKHMAQAIQERNEVVESIRAQELEEEAQQQYYLQHPQHEVDDRCDPVTHVGPALVFIFKDFLAAVDPVTHNPVYADQVNRVDNSSLVPPQL